MWELILQQLVPPTRIIRYCCSILKERGGEKRFITTGVRWAESAKRKKRGIYEVAHRDLRKRVFLNNDNDDRRLLFETCTQKAKRICNPIIDWTDTNIWSYIEAEKIPINPLYQCEYSRIGCIGCPMAGTTGRQKAFSRYPKYREGYIRTFDRMLERRKHLEKDCYTWNTEMDVFRWWMEGGVLPGQISLEDYDDE